MKLQKIHLFIILLFALLLCSCLGGFLREGMTSSQHTSSKGKSTRATDGESNNTIVSGSSGTSGNANTNNNMNGVSYSDIPPGQQDLYVLKSQVIPPVSPDCPAPTTYPRQEACPPCPACERCPEPAFECKKVPNYASANDNYLPRPVMSDFSQFGM